MWAKISLILASLACAVPAMAIEASRKAPATPKQGPPFRIGGFTYSLQQGRIHMNVCGQPSCGAGSKVSYIFYAPKPGKTFAEYKAERATIEKAFRSRLPPGATIKFPPPTQRNDKSFKTFESRRVMTMPDGRKDIAVSRTILGEKFGIDLISSGSNEKQVEENLAVFIVAAMLAAVGAGDKR